MSLTFLNLSHIFPIQPTHIKRQITLHCLRVSVKLSCVTLDVAVWQQLCSPVVMEYLLIRFGFYMRETLPISFRVLLQTFKPSMRCFPPFDNRFMLFLLLSIISLGLKGPVSCFKTLIRQNYPCLVGLRFYFNIRVRGKC